MKQPVYKRALATVLAVLLALTAFPTMSTEADAVAYTGCLSQHDSRWSNYSYGGGTISATGCGILSLVNTVGYLSGERMDIPSVASWAHSIRSYNVNGADGVYRFVLYPQVQAKYGSTYGFTIDCGSDGEGYWAGSSSTMLKNHLLKGGVAIGHVPNHFISIVGYDANTNKFHIYDSSATAARGTQYNNGDVWVTQSALATGRLCLDWFCLLTSTREQETWIERASFDVMVYRDRNQDLAGMTDSELKQHWLNHGIKEGRASSPILDLGFYLNNNPDLKEAFGTDYEALYNHFIIKGYKEYRKSSALFDGTYYCEENPDVASSFGDEYLKHYVNHGMAEGRRASLTFDPDYYWYIRPDVAETWPEDYVMCAKHYAGHGINAQIEAYDHEYPVISDAVISNISADGYTVSCTITDNWGLSAVAFPTWTLLNDQDDLPEDFMNTQGGTKDGDTYTFQVKASEHNFELGHYVTHIYAVDKGGNKTQFRLDPVEVTDALDEIVLVGNTRYALIDGILDNVGHSTTVDALLDNFENDNLVVTDWEGNIISGSSIVGTGTTLSLYKNTQLIESITVVVTGDVDGNGGVDSTDYIRIKSSFLGELTLETCEHYAADIDRNGVVDATDYMRIKAHFLGLYHLGE